MKPTLIIAALTAPLSLALSVNNKVQVHETRQQLISAPLVNNIDCGRRSLFSTVAVAFLGTPQLVLADNNENQVEWNVFNGLIFNYRGGGFNGLDASTLDEPSIPFLEFGSRLQKGEVAFVELYAPDGDVAYATFKSKDGSATLEKPIRIGQGYPTEQHDGYSSPAFVVRALKNYNVPYKFVVPGLEKYK